MFRFISCFTSVYRIGLLVAVSLNSVFSLSLLFSTLGAFIGGLRLLNSLVWYSLGVLLFIRTGCLFVLLLLCLFHVVVVIMTSLACVVFHGRLVVEQVLGSLGLVVQGPWHCWSCL